MKTVIIFGGSGFIGQNIIRYLVKKNYRIVVPFQRSINEAKLRLFGNLGQIIPLKFHNLNDRLIHNMIHESCGLINLKTIWQENKFNSYKKNILSFNIHLVDLINSIDREKSLIFFSGLGVNDESLSLRIQSISKVEKYIKKNVKNSSIIRPSIIIGDKDQFISKLLPFFKFSYFIPLFGNGKYKLQPVFVDDVAKSIEIIFEKKIKGNNIFELTGPEIFTYKTLYKYIAECLGVKRALLPINFSFAKILVSLLEKTPFNIITKDQLHLFSEDNINTNKYKNFSDLNIFPKDIREIIRIIIKNKKFS